MSKGDNDSQRESKNHVVSIGRYFGEKAVEEIREKNGGKSILTEPVPWNERTPELTTTKE